MDTNTGQPIVQPLISYAALERVFSPERLASYADPANPDPLETVARYLWELALATAIQPVLHALEVGFRNELARAANRLTAGRTFRTAGIPSGLDAVPTMLMDREREKVLAAKERMGSDPRRWTEARLIAKLDFGFWVALCRDSYADTRGSGPRLWPRVLDIAFQKRPRTVNTRAEVYHRFDRIRNFRNRVAHHQSVWNQDYLAQHEYILESLAWISPKLADAARRTSAAPAVFRAGPGAYRPLAEQLLGPRAGGPPRDNPSHAA
jgi:hypothetical protein